jgi:putative hydrolase of the HAD superfamily
MQLLYEPPTEDMIRPGCRRVVEAALTSGWGVSVFSNDLGAFHGPEWAATIPVLQQVDQVIDCSHGPALKPEPVAYEWALDLLDVGAETVVFVDDQPRNVAGAEACGIESIWFDIADAEACWDRIGERVGV